jgi:quinol monooxygenase YgiN/uncharacterized protein YndB with AHSA1/START domain
MSKPSFVYITFIATTPEKLWQALTDPDFTAQYWFGYRVDARGRPGERMTALSPDGTRMHDDNILASDPPRRLVYEWKSLYEEFKGERASRVTFVIEQKNDQVKLTVTHDDFDMGSKMFPRISEGWPAVLSSLKSFLETGTALPRSASGLPTGSAEKPKIIPVENALQDEVSSFIAMFGSQLRDPTQPFTLLVRFQIGEGNHADVEAAFARARELTLRENGVIAFELNREARNATRFIVYERWKSLTAFEEHLRAPYITRLRREFNDMIVGAPEFHVLTPAAGT